MMNMCCQYYKVCLPLHFTNAAHIKLALGSIRFLYLTSVSYCVMG